MHQEEKLDIIANLIEPAIAQVTKSVWLRFELMSMDLSDLKMLSKEIEGCLPKEAFDLILVGLEEYQPN